MTETTPTLTWHEYSEDIFEAHSARELPAPYTEAHYRIEEDSGFRPGRPNEAPAWLLTLCQNDGEDEWAETDLGRHYESLEAAQAAADRYERTGDLYAGEAGLRLRDFNLDATFLPQDADDEDTRPCITVGGVQVYAYFDEGTGQLVISADYDTADPAVVDANNSVPTTVTIGGTTVFEA